MILDVVVVLTLGHQVGGGGLVVRMRVLVLRLLVLQVGRHSIMLQREAG